MTDSILDSVKLTVGLTPDNPEFDNDVLMHINSAFATLNQLGVGPIEGFEISDATTKWDDFLKGDKRFNSARTYVAQKVRLAFDPPSTGPLMENLQKSLSEIETRLNIAREYTIYGLPEQPGTGNPGTGLPSDGYLDGGTPTENSGGTPTPVYDGGTP